MLWVLKGLKLQVFPDATPHKTTGGVFGTISVQRGSAILEVTTLRTEGSYTVCSRNVQRLLSNI